tara:strand:+ start:1005 stop:3284 length:2280 start_codon:yes stop_codon:yes gene_type:complete
MSIEDDIKQSLGGLPPWVSEATLAKIASHTKDDNDKLKSVFESMTGDSFKYDEIKEELEKSEKAFKKANNLLVKVENTTKNLFSVVARDVDPLIATAELMQMGASAVQGVAGGITSFTQYLGPKGAIASFLVDGAVATGVAAVGVTSIYAKLMSEQEKTIRSVIDYGGVVGDLNQYTNMRGSLAQVGMSMQEMSKIMIGNKSMLANMPDSLMDSTQKFINFAGMVESETSKTMGDFGYNVEEQTARLLEEANLMFMTGKLEQFSQVTTDKIRKNFESSSSMTTFLAEKFGDQRSSLLALRSEALTNVDFMSAMQRNGEYLADKYGENAEENVKDFASTAKMMLGKILGPEFGVQAEQVLNNFIKDIQIDDSALNNMPKEMINMLSTLGPDVSKKFTDIIEKGGTGKLTNNETVMAIQSLAKSISSASPRFGDDPMIQQSNALIANARNAPNAFMDMTEETLEAGVDSVKAMAEQADSSIDAIDAARIGFRSVVHELTPGYEMGAGAVEGFSSALQFVEAAFKFLGIIPTPKEPTPAVYDSENTLHKNMTLDPGVGAGTGRTMGTVTEENYKDFSPEAQKAYDQWNKKQIDKTTTNDNDNDNDNDNSGDTSDVMPKKDNFSIFDGLFDGLWGQSPVEIINISPELQEDMALQKLKNVAKSIFLKNFELDMFKTTRKHKNINVEQDDDGRFFTKIRNTSKNIPIGDPRYVSGHKKVYADTLNKSGIKIKNMYEADSKILKHIGDISEIATNMSREEIINGR